MNKLKILFIIDDTILYEHHGVRRYVLSFANALSHRFKADFVTYRKFLNLHCFHHIAFTNKFIENNGFFENCLVGKTKESILKQIHFDNLINKKQNISAQFTTTYIGETINDDYYLVITAAPWIHIDKNILSCPVACIGLDAIPNIYAIENIHNDKLRTFAWEHKYGFNYYDFILAISDDSKNQISNFISNKNKVFCLPPIVPCGFTKINYIENKPQNRTIILAAPFDERKGLNFIPDIVNNSDADSLIIFGGIRCALNNLIDFFTSLNISNIEWWYSVTTEKQVELYQKSKMLLFPSLNEGLGLPVLESLACHRHVITTNIKPLNSLVDVKYLIELDDLKNSVHKINKVLNDEKNTQELSKKWNNLQLIEVLENIVKEFLSNE